jgi:hypothetical protein
MDARIAADQSWAAPALTVEHPVEVTVALALRPACNQRRVWTSAVTELSAELTVARMVATQMVPPAPAPRIERPAEQAAALAQRRA